MHVAYSKSTQQKQSESVLSSGSKLSFMRAGALIINREWRQKGEKLWVLFKAAFHLAESSPRARRASRANLGGANNEKLSRGRFN
jgi:hypothetical protein